jgi:hypothetical protein
MPDDLEFDPEDREAALERGFTQHDALMFRGKRLVPISAGTYSVLQRSGNRLISGNSTDPLGDATGFILLHSADPDERLKARSRVFAGHTSWLEYVYQYMEANPDIHADLLDSIPLFQRMFEDFSKTMTKSVSAGEGKKKSGAQVI